MVVCFSGLTLTILSPLVMNVTCKNRICTAALPCFAGAHAGTLTFALKHHKGSAKILIKTSRCLHFSAMQWEQAWIWNVSMQCCLCEVTTDKAQRFLTCDLFIVPAEPAPRFECLWAFYWEFQVCNPWLTDSAFIHYILWEWGHFLGGRECFFLFKQFVSFQ